MDSPRRIAPQDELPLVQCHLVHQPGVQFVACILRLKRQAGALAPRPVPLKLSLGVDMFNSAEGRLRRWRRNQHARDPVPSSMQSLYQFQSHPALMNQVPIFTQARAHLDGFDRVEKGQRRLRGWIFRPDHQIKNLDIHLDGTIWVSSLPLQERPDVRIAYQTMTRAKSVDLGWSGFDVTAPLPDGLREDGTPIICLTPLLADGRPLASIHTYFHDLQHDLQSRPQPPKELQNRIGGSESFLLIAGQLTSLILSAIGNYRPLWNPGKILDWGCGCGRVMGQMLKLVSAERLHGCDIDAEAIAWDQEHLIGPQFCRIEPYPPTTYPDDFFDIIYGISVMTHLDEETQLAWLRELQRITRPGAILALSVIGADLRKARMPASLSYEYKQRGFATYVPDYSNSLAEHSHHGYYKESFHSLDYIARTWSEFFQLLECVETEHQDIIVLRAR